MKKTGILCLAIIMCMFAVTGSIAYFTDSIDVQNVVKSGNLDIEQMEYERATDKEGTYLRPYTQNQAIYPSVHPRTPEERQTVTVSTKDADVSITAKLNQAIQGYVDKIVVSANGGSLNTYIRTFVAVPTAFDKEGCKAVHLDWNTEGGWTVSEKTITDTITVESYGITNVPYTIYCATNENILAPGDSAAPSLLGFYLDSQVNHNGINYVLGENELGSCNELKILVATQASQAIPTGIGEHTTRMTAVESLRETYDKVEKDEVIIRHPWVPEETEQ